MSFLWPMAWALGLLAIPVTIFYLIRTRLERKPVSTFLFWEHLAPQVYNHSLWRKLRRWISLALQLLFLLLLVFALSRPLASWESSRPATLIILLDASASMAATDVEPSRWEAGLKAAERRISQMRFFDTALLIEAGETPRVLRGWSRNKRALHRALATAKPATGNCDIRPALTLAHHLGNEQKNAEIMLISDGVWENPPEPQAMVGVQPHWIGGESENVGLTLFTARRSTAAPGEYQLIARATIKGEGSAELEVRRNGHLMEVSPVTSEPGKPWQKTWEGTATEAVRFEATLRPVGPAGTNARDHLAIDNQAKAGLAALRPVAVEIVAPPHPFLTAALESLPLVQLKQTWPLESLEIPEKPQPGKLTIFYRCLPPAGFEGAAVLLIEPEGNGFWGKANGDFENALVSEFEQEEAILRFASMQNLRLNKVRDYTPAPGTKVFAQSFGKPLIFGRWEDGASRWLAVSFGLEDSDLVFRTAFPILMGNLVQSLQPQEAEESGSLPGAAETALEAKRPVPPEAPEGEASAIPVLLPLAWWTAFPVWWWAVLLGAAWLLVEWWLYSRRMTE